MKAVVSCDPKRACERIELPQLRGKLDLELLGVYALRLGDEQPTLEQLELLTQPLVRCA
jgi:hypothetical protein